MLALASVVAVVSIGAAQGARPQGGASELVFPARLVVEATAAQEAAWGPAWEFERFRRDGDLGIRGPARAFTASDTWPQPARPQIRDYQRLQLTTSPTSPVVYQPNGYWYAPQPVVVYSTRGRSHSGHRGGPWTNRPR